MNRRGLYQPDIAIQTAPDFVETCLADRETIQGIRRRVIHQHGKLVVRTRMKRLAGIENKPRIRTAMLSKVLTVDINISNRRGPFKDQIQRFAYCRRADCDLRLVPAFGERVVGGPRLEIVRDGDLRPGCLTEGVGIYFW